MNTRAIAEERYRRIFGAYDVRGVVGEDFNSTDARAIAVAFGDYISPDAPGRFVIGYDGRVSSPGLAEAASLGLRESGHHVVHIGLSTTPMVYWYGAEMKFDGSIAVTASHLAPQYNGFKLCRRDAIPLSGENGLPEVMGLIHQPLSQRQRPPSEALGFESALALHAARIKQHLEPGRPIEIAVDAGNGVGGIAAEALFSPFDSVKIWKLGFHPDGMFPERSPNPLDAGALTWLSETVRSRKLAFGLAFDGDADRAVVVDERGRMVPPDGVAGLISRHMLPAHPGATILHDLRSSRALMEEIESAGGKPVMSRVGHAFIKLNMREHNALFASELSGHYYYADLHYTDNALRTLVEMINIVSAADRPLSELARPFERYPTSGEINLDVSDRQQVLSALEKSYADGRIEHLDGLSVDYPDWWFNARPSHTESVLRLNVGAKSKELLDEKLGKLMAQAKHAI
jgi:phosphomannomutase